MDICKFIEKLVAKCLDAISSVVSRLILRAGSHPKSLNPSSVFLTPWLSLSPVKSAHTLILVSFSSLFLGPAHSQQFKLH